MRLPQQLTLNTLRVTTWVGVTTLTEWWTSGALSSLHTELNRAGLHTLMTLLLLVTLLSLQRVERMTQALSGRALMRHLPWLAFSGWGAWLGVALSRGDWVQSQPWAAWVAPCLGVGFTLGGLLLGTLARRSSATLSLLTASLSALALSALDLSMLRGLYPQLHLTLYLLSGLCALIALEGLFTWRGEPGVQRERAAMITLPMLCVVVGSYTWLQLKGPPHLRSALTQASPRAALTPTWRAPSAGLGDLASALKPLSALNRDALRVEQRASRRALALNERTQQSEHHAKHVILIIVDTLRFDGLYQPLLPKTDQGERAPLATAADLPFLTAWRARDAHVFLNAYTQAGRTKLSTPALFTSGEVSRKGRSGGLHLAERLKRAGYQALALTPEYFLWPVKDGASHLLNPFERSWHFTEERQHLALELWRELLDQRDERRPLFAWVHLYMMHAPYFADDKRLSRRDGSAEERYRRALKTLDHHLKELTEELRRRGMLKDAIIALTSDHGEGLGDHGADGHGVGVFEEQSRTPLIIYDERLKGAPQRLHSEVVGNVDLTPTLSALAGLPPHQGDEGQSLLPLLMRGDEATPWPYSYLLSNGNGSERGVVTQARVKLSYKPRRAELALYDLKTDPRERQSLAGRSPDLLTALTSALVSHLPALALPKRLQRTDPARWEASRGEAIDAARDLITREETLSLALQRRLLRVATQLKAPQLIEQLAAKVTDESAQAWFGLEALKIAPALGERLLRGALTKPHSRRALHSRLTALSAFKPRRFGGAWLTALLSDQDPALSDEGLWGAWLTLSQSWPHEARDLTRYLTLLTQQVESGERPLARELLSRFSAPDSPRFLRAHPELLAPLTTLLTHALLHPEPTPEVELTRAALAASRTLAALLSQELRAQLRARCVTLLERDERAQLKKMAVEAMSALALSSEERSEVIQALIKRSKDRLILVPIIDTLSDLPSPRTTTFLKKMRRTARTGYARVSAKNALKKLKRGGGASKTKARRRRKQRRRSRRRGRPQDDRTRK